MGTYIPRPTTGLKLIFDVEPNFPSNMGFHNLRPLIFYAIPTIILFNYCIHL